MGDEKSPISWNRPENETKVRPFVSTNIFQYVLVVLFLVLLVGAFAQLLGAFASPLFMFVYTVFLFFLCLLVWAVQAAWGALQPSDLPMWEWNIREWNAYTEKLTTQLMLTVGIITNLILFVGYATQLWLGAIDGIHHTHVDPPLTTDPDFVLELRSYIVFAGLNVLAVIFSSTIMLVMMQPWGWFGIVYARGLLKKWESVYFGPEEVGLVKGRLEQMSKIEAADMMMKDQKIVNFDTPGGFGSAVRRVAYSGSVNGTFTTFKKDANV